MREWISVEDSLPKKYEDVLLFLGGANNEPLVGYLHDNGFIIFCGIEDEHLCYIEVTHWMPLPEPPNE